MAGEAAHMQLVDDGVFERNAGRHVFAPVEGPTDEEAPASRAERVGLAKFPPDRAVGEGRSCRVQQYLRRIEAMQQPLGTIYAPAVPKRHRQPRDLDMP